MNWAQTETESCGAAALMVALAEMDIGDLSRDREMTVWVEIRATGEYRGSIPGRIGLAAAGEGAIPRIWHDPERLQRVRAALGAVATFNVAVLLQQHEAAIAEARESGVVVDEGPTDPQAMVQAMLQGEALMAAFAVAVGSGITLHWRLYRFIGDTIWEMDPDGGLQSPKTENQIVQLLSEQTYIGVAVSVRRP